MPRQNRFEVPVEYESSGGEVEVKKGNFLETGELSPEAIAQALAMLVSLRNLYQKERKFEESVV